MSGFDGADAALHVPQGTLLRSRVVDDVAEPLAQALDRRLTGYAVLEPGGSLLLEKAATGVVTFEAGVPVVAYCETTDERGVDALAALAAPGPCSVELYELPAAALTDVHESQPFRVPPGAPAAELAGDTALSQRTREQAPEERAERPEPADTSAVEAFLEDEDRIERIQQEARAEAKERAAEWGLDGQIEED